MRLLAGDIGGTKTLLQLFEQPVGGAAPQPLRRARYHSAEWPGLAELVNHFLQGEGDVAAACFAVAGPVTHTADGDEHVRLTNLPWRLEGGALSAATGLPAVRLINDFEAVAFGIEALQPEELATLQDRPPEAGAPAAVLGAGTGLGVALLLPGPEGYRPWATEGGHVDFAPTDDLQAELLAELRGSLGRVSVERLLSGPGVVAIYRFLAARTPGSRPLPTEEDPAAAIARMADDNPRSTAARALDLFIDIYGAQAGNLALTTMARGGLYLAGGIAPKQLHRLQNGRFLAAFHDKGRMRPLLESLPVKVILNPEVGLLGAARAAARITAPAC